MIVPKGEPPAVEESDGSDSRVAARRISDFGGLTQFGVHVHTLEPGWHASHRHWHEAEDELLFMLEGEATVVDHDGEHTLRPGDAACWPAGKPNAHRVLNRSKARCSYLICGTRVDRDTVHYPDLGQTLHIDGKSWKIVDAHGEVLKQGVE